MSTGCQVVINDGYGGEMLFYRHSDGYPEGAMPTLQKFMDWIRRGIIRDNAEQSAGWLILIGAKEYETNYKGITYVIHEPAANNEISGWKCGAYEPAAGRHRDIEFLYILDLKKKTISCYAADFDGEGFPDLVKDKLQFVDSKENPWTPK